MYTLMAQLDDSDWGTYIMRANNHHRTHEHVCITHKQHARHTTAAHCATVPCSFLQLAFLLASSHIIMQTRVYIIAPVTISRKVPAQPRYAPPWSLTQTSVVTMAPACFLPLSLDLPVKSESAILNVQLQRPRKSESYEKHLAAGPVGTRNPGKDWLILFCSESSESECFCVLKSSSLVSKKFWF